MILINLKQTFNEAYSRACGQTPRVIFLTFFNYYIVINNDNYADTSAASIHMSTVLDLLKQL